MARKISITNNQVRTRQTDERSESTLQGEVDKKKRKDCTDYQSLFIVQAPKDDEYRFLLILNG